MHLSSVSPEYFCPANKECPCFLILLFPLSTPAAQQESSLPWQYHVLFCLPYKFQISRICGGVLASCFSSQSLFPLFLCCLSLISVSLLPRASSNTRCGTSLQLWTPALAVFLSSASCSFMQQNWASISNPLPHSPFPNLLIRVPQCWPGWSSEIVVQFCCQRILTLETSEASVFCVSLKFVFLIWMV